MEQEKGKGKLIPSENLESRHKGKAMVIEKQTHYRGQEKLKGIQPEERALQRSRDRGMDYGGL